MRNYQSLADAWVKDDREVLDTLSAPERRALGLIASGAPADKELEAAGAEFVRGIKATSMFRLTGGPTAKSAAGPILTRATERENVIPWVYSDETVDRAGDIIRQSWELSNYKANPVVLWGHAFASFGDSNADVPIGKSISIRVEDKQLIGDIEFAVAESEKAATIYRLARGGYIKAGSVGFRPLKVSNIEDPTEREKLGLGRWGMVIERAELLEFSPCAIPCNPNALQQGVKSGVILATDADLFAAMQDPTEREWEKIARKRARSFVAMHAKANEPDLAAAVTALARAVADLQAAQEDDAASRRMLARAITDLGGRVRAADAAVAPKLAASLTAADAEKIRGSLDKVMTNLR